MTKAIILELTDREATVLCDDGDIRSIPVRPGFEIGMEIDLAELESAEMPAEMPAKRRSFSRTLRSVMSAAACLIALLGVGSYLYFTPVTYLDLSINPAVHMSVNRFGKVVSVKGLNADGEALIASKKYRGELVECFRSAIADAAGAGYLAAGGDVHFALLDDDLARAERYERDLMSVAGSLLASDSLNAKLHSHKIPMSGQDGLYAAIEQAVANDPDTPLNSVYENTAVATEELWLSEAEFEEGMLELEFTRPFALSAHDRIYAVGEDQTVYECEMHEKEHAEWELRIPNIKDRGVYTLYVETSEGVFTALFYAQEGWESEPASRVPDQNREEPSSEYLGDDDDDDDFCDDCGRPESECRDSCDDDDDDDDFCDDCGRPESVCRDSCDDD